MFHLRLVGVSHFQEALSRTAQGEPVRFIHEPDNPHDETAIRVDNSSGETIGYAPRNSWVHRAVHEQGRGVTGAVASIGMSRACLLGVMVTIALCDDEPAVKSYYPDRRPPEPPKGGYRYWISEPTDRAKFAEGRR